MANALVQVTFHHDSALPEDDVVNTFSVNTAATPLADAGDAIAGRIEDFYSGPRISHPIDWYLSNALSGFYDIKMYDRADAEPRVPKWEALGIALGAAFPGSATPYPSEVCVTASFQAAEVSGQPQARRRGRVFIGPLNPGAAAFTDGKARVAPIFIGDLNDAMLDLKAGLIADGYRWQVWSAANNAGADVDNGWVDNALDTQRRRGEKATVRTTWA